MIKKKMILPLLLSSSLSLPAVVVEAPNYLSGQPIETDCVEIMSAKERINKQIQEFNKSKAKEINTEEVYNEEIGFIEEVIEYIEPLGYEVTIEVSYYCPCSYCCGVETGITASGTYATEGRTIALPTNIPFGTQIEIEGNIYTNEDTGSFIKYTDEGHMRVDIYLNSHEKALEYGRYVTTGFIYY